MTDINIVCHHNEDLDRDYVLRQRLTEFATVKRPTLAQTEAIDITGRTFEAEAKIGGTVVQISVTIVDGTAGKFKLFIDQAILGPLKGKLGTYDILMTTTGVTQRIWGGTLQVLAGTTVLG